VVAADLELRELLERWVAHIRGLGRSDATLYNYEGFIERNINPALGSKRLSKLSALDIDRLYSRLTKQGLAPATVRQVHAILRASLNQAMRWGLVGRNVAKLATPPSQPQREQHPPSNDDVRALLVAASDIDPLFGLYARLVAATGVRRSEACGVRWSDVDFDRGTVRIERSYQVLPGATGDRPTKTRSARTINLDPETVDALRDSWDEAKGVATLIGLPVEARRSGYVFTNDPTSVTAWRPDGVNDRWGRARKAAGVPSSIRLHDLRHWQATQLLDAGVPVPTVAARLGHADGTTTMKVYAHRTRRADEQAAAVIGLALRTTVTADEN